MTSRSPLPEWLLGPHQLHSIPFPKIVYEKKKVVYYSFHPHLFSAWSFLQYNEWKDSFYCHTQVKPFC